MANGFYNFPHTRTYDSDLGFLIRLYKDVEEKLDRYLETSTITFADPITWDITEQYTALTCVIDRDGTAYLSKQPVPAGIAISNTDYWLPIFNYDDNINQLRDNIAYNTRNMDTIGVDLKKDDLVFWAGNIYIVKYNKRGIKEALSGILLFVAFTWSWIPINIDAIIDRNAKWDPIKHKKVSNDELFNK